MRLLTAIFAVSLASAPLAAETISSVAEAQAILDRIEKELAVYQATLEDLEPQVDEVGAEVRKNRYGGASNPEVSGSYGIISRNSAGYHLLRKNGVGIVGKIDVSLLARLSDGSSISAGFGPVFTPGAFPKWIADDSDEIRRGTGTASRLGTLLGTFRMGVRRGPHSATVGFQSFQTSVLTLSGRLSNRPIVFDKNPYMTNTTSKAYYENQFLTGVPKRAPEESEFYIMGPRVDLALPMDSTLMMFLGAGEGFYDNESLPRVYGGMLTMDKLASLGGKYKLIAYNRSNDSPEIVNRGGDIYEVFYGLTNNSLFSAMFQQKLGPAQLEAEVAGAWYDDALIHETGIAARGQLEMPMGSSVLRLGGYRLEPGYLAVDPQGKLSSNGSNLVRYRLDPDKPGRVIHQTNIGDPTIPINNTDTYSVGGQIRLGNAFLNLNLQNSRQIAPTDSRIWSQHFLNGNNLNTSMWFAMFNNNYIGWLPNSGRATAAQGHYGLPDMEREFFYNPRRDPPAAAFQNTTYALDEYNQRYSLVNDPALAGTSFAPYTIPDVDGKLHYNNAYRMMEAGTWRQNFEGVLLVDRATGRALAPSVKSISHASADLRLNISDYIPLRRPLYWQAYSDITAISEDSLFIPSMDPNHLFVQTIADTTLVAGVTETFYMMLYMGIETWNSNRSTYQIARNGFLRPQLTTLEYHDRSVGAGFDWNAIPSRLNVYMRVKYLVHHDSFSAENGFIARFLELEMKSYF
jgi:hypothetical protein